MLDNMPDNIPLLSNAPDEFTTAFMQQASLAGLPSATTICHQGNRCQQLPILVSGQARVFKLSDSGKEITLYRITPGESCVLTASCIMSDLVFPAIAVTEQDIEVILIPASIVAEWFETFPVWRQFIFHMISLRLSSILTVIEEVAFQRMDIRLSRYLASAANDEGYLKTTHQQIADELGTAREVVTRLLKDLEADNAIEMSRGMIHILRRDRLLPDLA
jgi:CRP/FNR family transcriptional regulator